MHLDKVEDNVFTLDELSFVLGKLNLGEFERLQRGKGGLTLSVATLIGSTIFNQML